MWHVGGGLGRWVVGRHQRILGTREPWIVVLGCPVLFGGIGHTRERETHWFRWTWGLVSFCVVGWGGCCGKNIGVSIF
jgi:hypothetical protein